ncbi:MAG: hypothetical protein ABIJ82_01890 [Patescibacteria group bacterium]
MFSNSGYSCSVCGRENNHYKEGLKDPKTGKPYTNVESLKHYQQMTVAINETIRIMREIDTISINNLDE